MTVTDESTNWARDATDPEPRIRLELELPEAEALRTWLLKAAADGRTSLDDPLVSGALNKLGRAIDMVRATANIRHELDQAGLSVAHLSDEQVRELGRRVSEAVPPSLRN
ncbi:MAG TPA: hypothetical protein VMU39_15925 [Solirubrobacteraceae bacterium]|nr:hypothetical protein [Solirubrobacteraceae bacterium]